MKEFEIVIEAGTRYEIIMKAIVCGSDLSVTVCGGELHHVGAVVLACGRLPGGGKPKYSATASTLTVMDHKDDVVAKKMAVYLADALGANVTATVGIHVDDATMEDLKHLQTNCMAACDNFMQNMR